MDYLWDYLLIRLEREIMAYFLKNQPSEEQSESDEVDPKYSDLCKPVWLETRILVEIQTLKL